ncbi:hydroxyacylglutathione hydrolase [Lutimaribacter pacificus]|uniref:Hydroxyacylglutathione hydrolase n=1 Tax=Lutimaribacter pacificus TaxID=391948 RepID=A0A1H0H1E6_9RHOB|nr:hydroxyacylglutathione hydrolase [Lutimaribacter pacificus]SDO12943.1 hydroxyacylglutathione hydrolase [Lutimaribacter pacificus]SHJ94726.1 hydroxyacylglutathione hydrolase [Lutimaribacter pacificus]
MPLEIVTIPCLSDNYAYLAHDRETGETALVDIPEAGPILDELDRRGWRLSHILITHHHPDHVQGIDAILAAHPARVVGAAADAHRLPPLDVAVKEGDSVRIGGETGHVIDVSGHTIGHIAFHFPQSHVAFTADSLMALGCGRVFEGTFDQMYDSLQKLAALPPETLICSGHEYTAANARFAMSIEPGNPDLISRVGRIEEARAKGLPTVPSLLSVELATNPFLRADQPGVQDGVDMPGADPARVFAEVRRRKDAF